MPRLKCKTYRVVGAHTVDGHQPGDTFQAVYSAAHEQYLITAGHLAVAATAATQPQKEE